MDPPLPLHLQVQSLPRKRERGKKELGPRKRDELCTSYVTSNSLVCQRDHLGQLFLGDQVVPARRKKKRREVRERKRRDEGERGRGGR